MQNKPPVISIKMVPAGIELVLTGLNKLPREEVDDLYKEISAQYHYQLRELLQKAAEENSKKAEPLAPTVPAKKIKLVKKVTKK